MSKDVKTKPTNTDAPDPDDGFNASADEARGNRIIVGAIESFKDNEWSTGGLPADPNRKLVAVGALHFLQRWSEQRVVETITARPLPDVDDLNGAIPRKHWELDLNGNPRPPWQHAHALYLLDLGSAERTTYVSATIGGAIAVSRLKDRVAWMRKLRNNPHIVPQVEPTSAPMNTRFGPRKRPEFRIPGWFDFGAGGGLALPASGLMQLSPVELQRVTEPTVAEDLNDEIPWK